MRINRSGYHAGHRYDNGKLLNYCTYVDADLIYNNVIVVEWRDLKNSLVSSPLT